MLCLHAVTDEDGHSLENEDESGSRLCGIVQSEVRGLYDVTTNARAG